MSRVRMLSTDFDGTLIVHPGDGRCVGAFAEVLEDLRRRAGVWVVNTGRSLEHAVEGLEMFGAPVEPDFLLTSERDIFCRGGRGGWTAHGGWNEECARKHDELFESARGVLREIREMAGASEDVTIIEEGGREAGLVTSSEEVMDEVVRFIDSVSVEHPDFSYQRNTVYLRYCHRDYDKGASLGEVGRMLGIPREAVLAAGDHHNDVPMLDGRHAGMACCPSNAIGAVKEVVRKAGGHVASLPAGDGVAEAWWRFQG